MNSPLDMLIKVVAEKLVAAEEEIHQMVANSFLGGDVMKELSVFTDAEYEEMSKLRERAQRCVDLQAYARRKYHLDTTEHGLIRVSSVLLHRMLGEFGAPPGWNMDSITYEIDIPVKKEVASATMLIPAQLIVDLLRPKWAPASKLTFAPDYTSLTAEHATDYIREQVSKALTEFIGNPLTTIAPKKITTLDDFTALSAFLHVNGKPYIHDDGSEEHIVHKVRDVTARVVTEDALIPVRVKFHLCSKNGKLKTVDTCLTLPCTTRQIEQQCESLFVRVNPTEEIKLKFETSREECIFVIRGEIAYVIYPYGRDRKMELILRSDADHPAHGIVVENHTNATPTMEPCALVGNPLDNVPPILHPLAAISRDVNVSKHAVNLRYDYDPANLLTIRIGGNTAVTMSVVTLSLHAEKNRMELAIFTTFKGLSSHFCKELLTQYRSMQIRTSDGQELIDLYPQITQAEKLDDGAKLKFGCTLDTQTGKWAKQLQTEMVTTLRAAKQAEAAKKKYVVEDKRIEMLPPYLRPLAEIADEWQCCAGLVAPTKYMIECHKRNDLEVAIGPYPYRPSSLQVLTNHGVLNLRFQISGLQYFPFQRGDRVVAVVRHRVGKAFPTIADLGELYVLNWLPMGFKVHEAILSAEKPRD